MLIKACVCILALQILTACNSTKEVAICQEYNWNEVIFLVEPYMDEDLHTTLIMQGQSSEYNTAQAASEALGSVDNKEVKDILEQIIKADCS